MAASSAHGYDPVWAEYSDPSAKGDPYHGVSLDVKLRFGDPGMPEVVLDQLSRRKSLLEQLDRQQTLLDSAGRAQPGPAAANGIQPADVVTSQPGPRSRTRAAGHP